MLVDGGEHEYDMGYDEQQRISDLEREKPAIISRDRLAGQ